VGDHCLAWSINYTNCSATCEQRSQGIDPCHRLRMAEFSIQWVFKISLQGTQSKLQASLSRGEAYEVSDSSFKDMTGSVAWIIEGANATNCLIGQWHTLGQPNDHSSFCIELAGIVGVLYTITFWPLQTHQSNFRLAFDGLSVVS